MISIDKSVWKQIANAPHSSCYKIFFYIALNQPEEGIYGYQTTKEQLAIDLNLNIRTIFDSLKWLKNEILVQELKLVEDSDFMVNPRWVMNNSDYKERFAEWNRRCNLDSDREVRLRRERQLRKLRKEKNQKK